MSWKGYCQQCGGYVALEEDLSCVNGHQRSQIRDVRDAITGLPYRPKGASGAQPPNAAPANGTLVAGVPSYTVPTPIRPTLGSAGSVGSDVDLVNTIPLMVGLIMGLVVLVPTGVALFFDLLIPDAWFELSYLVVAGIVFGVFWFVGSTLTRTYEGIVASAQSGDAGLMAIPRSLNQAYGLMLVALLPYLLYLFVFALYCVEFVVVRGIIGISSASSVPLFLPIGLFIMALGSLWGVGIGVWKLLVPPRPDPLGVRLTRNDCPQLWILADKVASDAGTTTVGSIILTPDAGVSVWEQGSLPMILLGNGRRHMQIGLSGIHNMTVCELMSILRHEYAHFANSDTRWGAFTHAMGQSLVSAFAATPGLSSLSNGFSWIGLVLAANPAWFVYWVFVRLFFRSTGGFSRLGEVMADRDAIAYAGGNTFANALSKVVVNDRVYAQWLGSEGVIALQDASVPVPQMAASVSALSRAMTPEQADRVAQEAGAADWAARSPYDSHPPLESRLAFARSAHACGLQDACDPAWSLIDDWNARDRQVSDLWFTLVRHRLATS